VKRDLTVSGFVFALVSVGVILAAYTEGPLFWLLIGPAPVIDPQAYYGELNALARQRVGRIDKTLHTLTCHWNWAHCYSILAPCLNLRTSTVRLLSSTR
jgi:hypothetical protein